MNIITSPLKGESKLCWHSFGPNSKALILIQFRWPTKDLESSETICLKSAFFPSSFFEEAAFSPKSSISLILFCIE